MKYLYLWLDLGSFIIPFLFSFHPRLQFYKKWRSFFPALGVMMLIFIPWDIWFTHQGYWGFNPAYLTGISLWGLPIEEWLFFICIPYACIFTHYALQTLWPKMRFSIATVNVIHVSLVTVLVVVLWYHYDKWYTLVNFCFGQLILGYTFNYRRALLQSFLPTYLVILIPFFIVNGILTGSGIEDQVVWYNNAENLGIRMVTIPVEDLIYNLGMLLTTFVVTENLEAKRRQRAGAMAEI